MSEAMQNGTGNGVTERQVTARVVSSRMDKSASVEITRMVRHRLYGKYLRRRTRLLVHDEANECRQGDIVKVAQCRPISRNKSWRVVAVVRASGAGPERAESATGEAASA